MFQFVFRKMLNKKWMVISLLIGNLLLVSIAAASPMYASGILQRTLTKSLSHYLLEYNEYPGIVKLETAFAHNAPDKPKERNRVDAAGKRMQAAASDFGVPILEQVTIHRKNNMRGPRAIQIDGVQLEMVLDLASYSDLEQHITITHGRLFDPEIRDHVIEVIVNERTYSVQNLMLNEEIEIPLLTDAAEIPYRLKVVGIFEVSDPQDPYWIESPSYEKELYVMDESNFLETIANPKLANQAYTIEWDLVLDYTKIQEEQVTHILQVLTRLGRDLNDIDAKNMSMNIQETLELFVRESKKLNTTIWVLQAPIFILLAAFIFMVSRQMLEMEQNEISVFKSRGAAKRQIIFIYLLQSILIALLGILGGIPLGVLICKVLGASNAFLEFVQRAALPVKLLADVWIFSAAAALFSVCTMVLPVFRYAKVGIVETKRRKSRRLKQPWWQLIFLDVLLLGISLYGLYRFQGERDFLAQQVLDGGALDPMLYICSSLFMIGAGLLFLRIFPWLIRLVFWLGKRWWPPAIYASFLRIQRTKDNQGFLIVFLILTVAMGLFNAQTARTINTNAEEELRYTIGADVVLQESWAESGDADSGGGSFIEPMFEKYLEMDEIESITKVLVNPQVTASVDGGKLNDVTVMGIHTKEFGETAWFKTSLLPYHWYEYLNAMSQNSNAILVSSNFRDQYGYEVGDTLTYTNKRRQSVQGIIYGFVDYWPSFAPQTNIKGSDGKYVQKDNYLIVAHLSQLQAVWGITPYQVWMDIRDSSQFLYDYAEENKVLFLVFRDTNAELIDLKNDPIFQGTNGVLTIGFVVVLLLCTTGFLIYWILSIRSRTLQFGIFRAMGMSMGEVLAMLVTEQIFISGSSIAMGVLIGKLSAALFTPLIQIAYSTADRVIPLEIISDSGDYLRLGMVIGVMMVLCMVILGVLISKIRISQALKLGED